jgi:ankyrin repeat protein
VVQLLVDRGADVSAQGGEYGQAAALDGREAVVQLLVDRGADVNALGGECGNALQAAALDGHELFSTIWLNNSKSVVRLLLDLGADRTANTATLSRRRQ